MGPKSGIFKPNAGWIGRNQALMAFADTAMVLADLAANRGNRPMTTVDQTIHVMRAVTASDVLAEAGSDGLVHVRDAVVFFTRAMAFRIGLSRHAATATPRTRAVRRQAPP